MNDESREPLTLTPLHRAVLALLSTGGRMTTEEIHRVLEDDPFRGAPDASVHDVYEALMDLAEDERVQPAEWAIVLA